MKLTILQHGPKGSHESLGGVERANQEVAAQVRTMIIDAEEKLAMAGDKGARGTKIDPNLRVNEKQRTGTVYVDGKKKVTADRNRDPAELGLKQWSGASGPTTWR